MKHPQVCTQSSFGATISYLRRYLNNPMSPAVILVALAMLLGIPTGVSPLWSPQPAQSQSDSQSSQQESPARESPALKPCPDASESTPAKTADCKSVPSTKHKKHLRSLPTPSSSEGPAKTVVRNGSTTEPTVAISGMSNQEASLELSSTNQLLASADANLKQIANRQLDTALQDTVRQIKSYMEQARTAAANGEVQRAHTLANKANLLSADLAQPRR